MKRLWIAAVALIAAWQPAATAEPVVVMGIAIGGLLERPIAECKPSGANLDWCSRYRELREREGSFRGGLLLPPLRGAANPVVRVPSWVSSAEISIGKDDVVGRLNVSIDSIDMQKQVIDAVTERFGPPATIKTEEAQTRGGLRFDVTQASWSALGLHISHNCQRIDRCTLSFSTDKWLAEQADIRRRQQERDKL